MIAIASLVLVLSLSIIVTRVATIALAYTGMSKEAARFQARSAFTGAGFTTRESESVVNHPVRRRIVLILMLLGNAGVVTAVSSLILTFVRQEESAPLSLLGFSLPPLVLKVGLLVASLVVLWALAQSRFVDRHLTRLIEFALKRYTRLDVVDYASVLHLGGEYRLSELSVQEEDWIKGRTLRSAQLREEGLLVIGVQRSNGEYLGSPGGDTELETGDQILLYGRATAIERLDERRRDRAGYEEHARAVEEQQEVARAEKESDRDRS